MAGKEARVPKCWGLLRPMSLSSGRLAAWLGAAIGVGMVIVLLCGCHRRQFYRHQADRQGYRLIAEKESDPRWYLPEFSVYPDARSRFYDVYDPDRPPMPPDDPASHQFMHCVYGKKGYKRWHQHGDILDLENPCWRDHLGEFLRQDGEQYVIDLPSSIQLALVHSPGFQQNFETIYLSSLDVAFERFQFDLQFFGGNETGYTHGGAQSPARRAAGLSSSLLETETYLDRGFTRTSGARAGIQRLLPGGGQFLAEFANTFLWQFAGPDRNLTSQSLVGFVFTQPLLRGGGRDIIMERLTIAERVLLANVRQMVRYRQGFLLDVAYGSGAGQGPQRRGGFFGGTGLTGFTGQGQGGFGGVGEATGFGRAGGAGGGGAGAGGAAGGGFAAGVAGNVGGFYGLVQQLQQIQNREANLAAQLENLARVEALFDAGRIDRLQVEQFRQNVQSARSQHLEAVTRYEQSLETYLGTMGLPPDLPIRIDERAAVPFQFVEPATTSIQSELKTFYHRIRADKEPSRQTLRDFLDQFGSFRARSRDLWNTAKADLVRLESMREQRLAQLTDPAERDAFDEQVAALRDRLERFEKRLAEIEASAAELERSLPDQPLPPIHQGLAGLAESLGDLLLELSLVQAGIRLESVVIEPVRLESARAFHVALANRLDIMNNRAEVVDQWRLIRFNAQRLECDLDLVFNGSLGTLGRNPVKFDNRTGTFSAGVRFDAPLTRLQERNEYRQSLIDYQRVRRDYIRFEDSVHQGLRALLRRLGQFEQEMQLRRTAMRIAIRTVEHTQEQLRQPPRAGAEGQAASLGPTAVRDLLAALADLLQTQNDVMATYLNYELLRVQLYRELGIIEFDENGLWIDRPLEEALKQSPQSQPYSPPLPLPEPLAWSGPAGAEELGDAMAAPILPVDFEFAEDPFAQDSEHPTNRDVLLLNHDEKP